MIEYTAKNDEDGKIQIQRAVSVSEGSRIKETVRRVPEEAPRRHTEVILKPLQPIAAKNQVAVLFSATNIFSGSTITHAKAPTAHSDAAVRNDAVHPNRLARNGVSDAVIVPAI